MVFGSGLQDARAEPQVAGLGFRLAGVQASGFGILGSPVSQQHRSMAVCVAVLKKAMEALDPQDFEGRG